MIHKSCSYCRGFLPEQAFFRKDKAWKTCNKCSENSRHKRQAETARAGSISDGLLDLHLAPQHINQQEQIALMAQQQQFQSHWQQRRDARMTLDFLLADPNVYDPAPLEMYEYKHQMSRQTQQGFDPQYFQPQNQQSMSCQSSQPEPYSQPYLTDRADPNQGMLPDYTLLHPNSYCGLDGLANGEQQPDNNGTDFSSAAGDLDFEQCLTNALCFELDATQDNGNVQGPFELDAMHDSGFYQRPTKSFEDLESGVGAGLNLGADANLDLKTDVNLDLEADMNIDLGNAMTLDLGTGRERVDSIQLAGPSDPHTQPCLFHPYLEGLAYNHSFCPEPVANQEYTFVVTTSEHYTQPNAPAKPVRKPRIITPPVCLDAYFADFNPSDDILRQPTSSQHNLTGESLAKEIISEIGLAIRLAELHHRWNAAGMRKTNNFFKEAGVLDRLEEREKCTPWGPLSDWLVMYQVGLEEILDKYGHGTNIDLKTAYKVRADKFRLAKSLLNDLKLEVHRLIESRTEALFELIVELRGQNKLKVKLELNKQIRLVKAAVEADCKTNGLLRL